MATATPSSLIYDASIAHQIDILRFSTGEVRKLLRLLAEAERDIVAQLQTLAGSESSAEVRLEQVLGSTRAINRQAYAELERRLGKTMEELAPVESEFQGDLLANQPTITASIGYPSTEDLIAAVKARPFDGKYLREWASQIEAGAFGRLQSAVRVSFFEGESIDQLVRRIRGTKANAYQDGIMEINRRSARAVARTAIAHTANVAREETWKANAAIMRGVRWSSVLDGRTTAVCRARDGKIYPLDKGPRPPAHWQCLPGDALVTARHRITGASKRWYDGRVVVFRTASGNELSCTPNHPILTDRGWVSACMLDVGAKVVCDGVVQRETSRVDVDHQNVPARIEEVAEAVLRSVKMVAGPVPVAAEDFHGDGMDGQIAIVASNRFLQDGSQSAPPQHGGEATLGVGNGKLPLLAGLRNTFSMLIRLCSAAHRVVRRSGEHLAFLWAAVRHSDGLLLASATRGHAGALERALDGGDRDIEAIRNAAHSNAAREHRDDLLVGGSDWMPPRASDPHLDAALVQQPVHDLDVDAALAREILGGATGPVFLDDVVWIGERDFAGHVFNLETEKGFFVANGIVTHNCRSTTVPVLKGEPDELLRETYGPWLKRQPKDLVQEIMGVEKAELFLAGGLTVDRFVDYTGRELTLVELRRRYPKEWKRAFQ